MTCKSPISGAWVVTRTCPWNGEILIMGLFPEHKAALKRLEHIMDNPDDNEEYKLEYQVFSSYEQELEKHQACTKNRAEWDEKTKVYEDYKEREKMLAEYPDADKEEQEAEFDAASYT